MKPEVVHGAWVFLATATTLLACGGATVVTGSGDGGSSSRSSGSSSGSGGGSSTGSSGTSSSSGGSSTRVPAQHRPSDSQCSMPAPAGDCYAAGPPPGGCATDSQCTDAGTNGRCINPGGGPAGDCFCTYDACVQDTDCPSGETCACHGAPYTDFHGNTCVTGNCRTDADCGGEYCSPSSLTGICGDSLAGYYCHTSRDLCVDDIDCQGSNDLPGPPSCLYSTTDSRWECVGVDVCL